MDETEDKNVGLVSCVKFVPRGVAKAQPEKVQLSQNELEAIIKQTTEDLRITEEENSDDEQQNEEEMAGPTNPNDEFDLENYDVEQNDPSQLFGIGSLATFQNDDLPSGVQVNMDDPDSDEEDDIIKPTDNLILIGHVHGDASILEVYVHNEDEGSLYVHHDILLPSFPLCIEWLNRDPGDPNPGNLCAIGTMEPVIGVWDLDIIDCLEPAFKLGKKKNAKKNIKGVGHKKAVIDLSWNKNFDHVIASASADKTVLLWDIDNQTPHTKLSVFEDKVQSIQWHNLESQSLLTGCSDHKVRVFDCRSTDAFRAWTLSSEIEKVQWDPLNPFCFAASTMDGKIYYVDCRQETPMWEIEAHEGEVTGISLSASCPGLLVSISNEGNMKAWDTSDGTPVVIAEKELGIGGAQCLTTCPENPFVFAAGGDNKSKNFGVWDIRKMDTINARFGSRQLVGLNVTSN